jgi:hypothetical protein
MRHRSTYLLLVLIFGIALLSAANVFLPQGDFAGPDLPGQLPASRPVMALVNALAVLLVYGSLGFWGRHLSLKLGFPDLLDPVTSDRQRFVVPALIGICIGILFVVVDSWLASQHGAEPLPHPPFPTSLLASVVAGVGEELVFRLFFISFWVWLLSHVLLKRRAQTTVFWIIAAVSALAFAAAHLPSVMMMVGVDSITELPSPLVAEIFLLNGIVSLAAASYFKRAGFLAAAGIHFWTDVVWHVVWGMV